MGESSDGHPQHQRMGEGAVRPGKGRQAVLAFKPGKSQWYGLIILVCASTRGWRRGSGRVHAASFAPWGLAVAWWGSRAGQGELNPCGVPSPLLP